MGVLAHASIFGVTIFIVKYRCQETPGIPHAGDPMPFLPYPKENSALQAILEA